jgi:hypothetical protein
MRKIIFITALLLAVSGLTAQTSFRPGYIITQTGDTLHGEIQRQSGGLKNHQCLFRPGRGQELRTFRADEIRGYVVDNLHFYRSMAVDYGSRPFNIAEEADSGQPTETSGSAIEPENTTAGAGATQKVFLRILIDGSLKLYRYSSDYYFAYTDNDGLLFLDGAPMEITVERENNPGHYVTYLRPSMQFKGTLSYLMRDCPEVRELVQKSQYTEKSLMRVYRQYYRCIDTDMQRPDADQPLVNFKPGFMLGMNFSSMRFMRPGPNDYLPGTPMENSSTLAGGFSLEMYSHRLLEPISLMAELYLTQGNYTGTKEESFTAGSTVKTDVTVDLIELRIPVYLRYYLFRHNSWSPYINAGANFTMYPKVSSWVSHQNYVDGVPAWNITEDDFVLPKSVGLGLTTGLGIQTRLAGQTAFFEARYEPGTGFIKGGGRSRAHFNNSKAHLMILGGIRF